MMKGLDRYLTQTPEEYHGTEDFTNFIEKICENLDEYIYDQHEEFLLSDDSTKAFEKIYAMYDENLDVIQNEIRQKKILERWLMIYKT